jgi:exonuclease VII large subunit
MNAPTSSAATEKAPPVHLDVEAEISKLAEESIPKRSPQIESEVERIRSSITRLTSSSIDGLEGLTSELQDLQRFLNSEVQRVQSGNRERVGRNQDHRRNHCALEKRPGVAIASNQRPRPSLGLGSKY